ncbi:MAG TPA: VanW family protein [Candidatus Limnocylindrales bacterium]|nr:VanW family protein [Candidatus Limnocylindrales bacterium]
MTTRVEQLPAFLTPARHFSWRGLILSFVLTLLAVIVFAGAFVFGYAAVHAGKALPGVHVGGISLAGLDRASAEAALRERLPQLHSGHLTVQFADVQQRITYASIDRDYDMAAMLDQAFAVGHAGSLLDQVQDQVAVLLNGIDITPQMRWNETALEERLGAIAASAYREPQDAVIQRSGAGWTVIPAADGQTVDLHAGLSQAVVAVDSLSAADSVIRVPATVLSPAVSTAQAQAAVDRAESIVAADLAVVGGGTREAISADMLRGWVRLDEAGVGEWSVVLERDPVAQWVASVAAATNQEPVDASFKFKGDEVTAVPGKNGQQVDVEATTDAVYASLLSRAEGGPPAPTVNMAITVVEPEFTTEEAEAAAPRVEMISSWSTNYTIYEGNNFGGNITAPAKHLDGTVIEPGGTFDFWGLMPSSLAELEGVGPGGIIRGGRTLLTGAIGGGVCSVSTTVFNAAARAGLELGDRRNHSYYIERYPVGLDATVWRTKSAQQNLTFVNDTQYPVILRTINQRGKVTFEIWSLPNGRTVEFSKPRVENQERAKDYIEYTDELAAGQTKRLEYPRNGFESWVTRTVRDASGKVIHRDTFYSKYRTISGILLVGRGPTDPVAGTRVQR